MALFIISAVCCSSVDGLTTHCVAMRVMFSGARTRIPSRILLPSDQWAAVLSSVSARMSSSSSGRVFDGAGGVFCDTTAFSVERRKFLIQVSWMAAWARASAMIAGWWNSIPNPRWISGWRKPDGVSLPSSLEREDER